MSKARGDEPSATSSKLPRLPVGGYGKWMTKFIPHVLKVGGQHLLTIVTGTDEESAQEELEWVYDSTIHWAPKVAPELTAALLAAIDVVLPEDAGEEEANHREEVINAIRAEIQEKREDQLRNRAGDRKRLIDRDEQLKKEKTQLTSDLIEAIGQESALWVKMSHVHVMKDLQKSRDPRALLEKMRAKSMRVDEREAGLSILVKIAALDPAKQDRQSVLRDVKNHLEDYGYVTATPMNDETMYLFWNKYFQEPHNFIAFEEIAKNRKRMTNAEILEAVEARMDELDSDEVLKANLDRPARGKMAGTSHGPVAINAVGGAPAYRDNNRKAFNSGGERKLGGGGSQGFKKQTQFSPKPERKERADDRKSPGAFGGLSFGANVRSPTPQTSVPGEGWNTKKKCWGEYGDTGNCIHHGVKHEMCYSPFDKCSKCHFRHRPGSKCVESKKVRVTKAYQIKGMRFVNSEEEESNPYGEIGYINHVNLRVVEGQKSVGAVSEEKGVVGVASEVFSVDESSIKSKARYQGPEIILVSSPLEGEEERGQLDPRILLEDIVYEVHPGLPVFNRRETPGQARRRIVICLLAAARTAAAKEHRARKAVIREEVASRLDVGEKDSSHGMSQWIRKSLAQAATPVWRNQGITTVSFQTLDRALELRAEFLLARHAEMEARHNGIRKGIKKRAYLHSACTRKRSKRERHIRVNKRSRSFGWQRMPGQYFEGSASFDSDRAAAEKIKLHLISRRTRLREHRKRQRNTRARRSQGARDIPVYSTSPLIYILLFVLWLLLFKTPRKVRKVVPPSPSRLDAEGVISEKTSGVSSPVQPRDLDREGDSEVITDSDREGDRVHEQERTKVYMINTGMRTRGAKEREEAAASHYTAMQGVIDRYGRRPRIFIPPPLSQSEESLEYTEESLKRVKEAQEALRVKGERYPELLAASRESTNEQTLDIQEESYRRAWIFREAHESEGLSHEVAMARAWEAQVHPDCSLTAFDLQVAKSLISLSVETIDRRRAQGQPQRTPYNTGSESEDSEATKVNMVDTSPPLATIAPEEFARQYPTEDSFVYPGDKTPKKVLEMRARHRILVTAQCKFIASLTTVFILDTAVIGPSHYMHPSAKHVLQDSSLMDYVMECVMANGEASPMLPIERDPFLGSIAMDPNASSHLIGWHKLAAEHNLKSEVDSDVMRVYRKVDNLYLFSANYVRGRGFMLTHLDLAVAAELMIDDDKSLVQAVQAKKQSAILAAGELANRPVQRRAASVPTAPLVTAPPRQPITSQLQEDVVNLPLSADELHRAEKARSLHANNGHPSDKVLGQALDSNVYAGCDLTSRDVANAKRAFGDCEACIVSKMTDPPSSRASRPPAGIGSRIYADISPFASPTIGGNKFYHFAMEALTGYLIFVGVPSKSQSDTWLAAWSIVTHMNQHRFVVSEFCTDSENTYMTLKEYLGGKGIEHMPFPPYSHCVPIERAKRVINERVDTVKATLMYIVPPGLEGELIEYVMTMINNVPNNKTGAATPVQLITGRRAIAFSISWGQPVFVYDNRAGSRIAEKGIVINVRVNAVGISLKVYLPKRKIALWRSRHIDFAGSIPDSAWGFEPNSVPRSIHQRNQVPGPAVGDGEIPDLIEDEDEGEDGPNFDADHEAISTQEIQSMSSTSVPVPGFQQLNSVPHASPARVDITAEDEYDQPTGEQLPSFSYELPAAQRASMPLQKPAPPSPRADPSTPQAQIPRVHTPAKPPSTPSTPVQAQVTAHPTPRHTPRVPFSPASPRATPHSIIAEELRRESVEETQVVPPASPAKAPPQRVEERPQTKKIEKEPAKPTMVTRGRIRTDPTTSLVKPLLVITKALWVRAIGVFHAVIGHITLKAGLAGPHRESSEEAILKELKNIVETHDSIEAIAWEHLSTEQRLKARRNFMFLVHKFLANGDFDKVKARWVYGATNAGNIQDDEPRDTNSPTVNPITTLVLLFMAAAYNMEMEVHDVPAAFLRSDMAPDAQPLYGFIGPELTGYIRDHYPHLASKISSRGSLYFKLKKYIYGTNEASKRFYDTMAAYFISIGFTQSLSDPCLFTRLTNGESIFIGVYVDDLLVTASSKTSMEWISSQLRSRWETVYHTGDEFNYVGLHLVRDRANRTIRVDMAGNIKKLIDHFGKDIKACAAPAVESLMEQTGEPLDPVGRSLYMSLVMSVLYPARMVHLAVLFPTAVLATRMLHPTVDDLKHAHRLIGYLKTQVNGGFDITGSPSSALQVYVDASHSIHQDGRGHGGLIAVIGTCIIAWRCYKLQHVCLSSTESEISAVSEAVTYIIWLRDLLKDLGHQQEGATDVFQDNMSAVTIMEKGGSFKRTKHILTRYQFITEHVHRGVIKFLRCPTDIHVADLLTKVQPARRLSELLRLVGWTHDAPEGVLTSSSSSPRVRTSPTFPPQGKATSPSGPPHNGQVQVAATSKML